MNLKRLRERPYENWFEIESFKFEVGDGEIHGVTEENKKIGEVLEDGPRILEKKQQEMDWKTDEEFKKFMGNPSIEAAIKLEKKRADRKLKELDREGADNPIVGLFARIARENLAKEKERLEKAEETFKALDLNKVCIIFSPFFYAKYMKVVAKC